MKVVASIEARMGSSRLPGKVLKSFGEETTLSLLVKRLQKCNYLDDIIVATTTESRDEIICDWCKDNSIKFFRGSEQDVLDRVVKSHEKINSDLVVEITADCPFTDPKIAFWLFLAGPMTVIPLFLFLKGVDLAGLGTSGMIFFIAPTGQFLLGIFYYNEYFDFNKLVGFIIIWIAVAIYLHDLSREKIRN